MHQDIEAHRKIVSSVIRLCEKSNSSSLVAAARALERKYHELYLRSFEWQCLLDSFSDSQLSRVSCRVLDFFSPYYKLSITHWGIGPPDRLLVKSR